MAGDRGEVGESAYSMYFGVSCAFLAVDLMSKKRLFDFDRSRLGEIMLKGSAQLLGLLVERAQGRGAALEKKLNQVEWELEELKRRRTEDAKANEKVVTIFAAHEQRWITERKGLRLQIQALVNELQIVNTKHADAISKMEERAEEAERAAELKDEALEEQAKKRKELEEKLQLAQEVADELTERAKKEAQDHSAELWKHKTTFVELVSNQRQIEAELSRALRQAQAGKQELKEVFDRKQEAVAMAEKLSEQIEKMQKNSEQKDKILSAMMRKSKLDTAERQMLLKEVKISKAKKKQAELEMERWRNIWESSRHKKSSREIHSVEVGSSQNLRRLELLPLECSGHNSGNLILDELEDEGRREDSSITMRGENILTAIKGCDRYSIDEHDEAAIDDYQNLQDWIRKETEKYGSILEQKHYAEVEAFAEQMRQKDEKLEAFRWRVLSMELEARRLKSHIEGLDGSLSHLREDNIKLESMLLDKDQQIKSLKEQLSFHVRQSLERNNSNYFPSSDASALWLESRMNKKRQNERPEESRAYLSRMTVLQIDDQKDADKVEIMDREINKTDSAEPPSSASNTFQEHSERPNELPSPEQSKSTESSNSASENQMKNITLISDSTDEEFEEKDVNLEHNISVQEPNGREEEAKIADDLPSTTGSSSLVRKDTSWKMDIQALGISYKIKRLKQQLVVLEKLAAMKQTTNNDDAPSTSPEGSNGKKVDENRQQIKSLLFLKSLLGKQLKRYQSLEEKTDDLCRRMDETYRSGGRRELQNGRPREQTETLEHFLEETFQLQRYMVATGQKLMEMQSRISPSFHGAIKLDESVGFNMGQFADIVRTLFKEIQRGLEVRIARIIGDLEGTLACDGILHR